mgnify:CR=1 FL=1
MGVKLIWEVPDSEATYDKVYIYRATSKDGTYTQIASQSITDNTYYDMTGSTSHWYKIRFYDGTNVLPCWIEKWDSSNQEAKIWVKVPSIPANGTTTFYMYYGNSNVASASDGENTFLFFDDFESLSKWDAQDGGCGTIEDGKLVIIDKATCRYTSSISLQDNNIICEVYGEDDILNDDAELEVWLTDTSSKKDWGSSLNKKLVINVHRKSIDSVLYDWCEESSISNNTPPVKGIVQLIVKGQELKAKWIGDSGEIVETPSYADTSFDINNIDKIKVGIHSSSSGTARWDWVRIRKYTDPEPSVSIGSEEPS